MLFVMLSSSKLLYILLIVHQCLMVMSQLSLDAIESQCLRYKTDLFVKEETFRAIFRGAPEMKIVEDSCNTSVIAPFIVGGTPAKSKEFPIMARIGTTQSNNAITWFCGGTLLSNRFVLTAAHCFYTTYGIANRVRLGEINAKYEDGTTYQDFVIKRYIPHPQYNFSLDYHDIGLVELTGVVTFNEFMHPACLPIESGEEIDNFIAIGWGSTSSFSAASRELLKVKLDLYGRDACLRATRGANLAKMPFGLQSDSQICAGSKMSKDTCNGDSGGPLLARHHNYACMYSVVGVTSLGISTCGTENVPALYTRVNHYLDWISSIVWKSAK